MEIGEEICTATCNPSHVRKIRPNSFTHCTWRVCSISANSNFKKTLVKNETYSAGSYYRLAIRATSRKGEGGESRPLALFPETGRAVLPGLK